MVLAVKLSVTPEQIGLLLPAVGAAGNGFTVAMVVVVVLVHPAAEVTFTE